MAIAKPTRLIIVTLTAIAAFPLAAAAQPQPRTPPRLSAGVGAGLAVPLHSDFDFNARDWQISVRASVSDHFVLEGFFDEWRRSTEKEFPSVPLQGRDGVVGRVATISERIRYSTRTAGFNGLFRGRMERVAFTAGGGIGFMVYRRDFSQTLSGCEATAAQGCRDFQNRWTSSSVSVQGVAALDVAITSRLAAYAQYQVIAPTQDFGSMHVAVVGGARLGIW